MLRLPPGEHVKKCTKFRSAFLLFFASGVKESGGRKHCRTHCDDSSSRGVCSCATGDGSAVHLNCGRRRHHESQCNISLFIGVLTVTSWASGQHRRALVPAFCNRILLSLPGKGSSPCRQAPPRARKPSGDKGDKCTLAKIEYGRGGETPHKLGVTMSSPGSEKGNLFGASP